MEESIGRESYALKVAAATSKALAAVRERRTPLEILGAVRPLHDLAVEMAWKLDTHNPGPVATTDLVERVPRAVTNPEMR